MKCPKCKAELDPQYVQGDGRHGQCATCLYAWDKIISGAQCKGINKNGLQCQSHNCRENSRGVYIHTFDPLCTFHERQNRREPVKTIFDFKPGDILTYAPAGLRKPGPKASRNN